MVPEGWLPVSTGERLVLDLVRSRGAGPIMFGMTIEEAAEVMSRWGDVDRRSLTGPDPHLAVRDEAIQVRFERGKQVTSIELWRPDDDDDALVTLEGMDLFRVPANEILDRLRENGDEIDESDRFYPIAPRVTLGFNREDGEEREEEELAAHFGSVLIAPPGYYTSSDS